MGYHSAKVDDSRKRKVQPVGTPNPTLFDFSLLTPTELQVLEDYCRHKGNMKEYSFAHGKNYSTLKNHFHTLRNRLRVRSTCYLCYEIGRSDMVKEGINVGVSGHSMVGNGQSINNPGPY